MKLTELFPKIVKIKIQGQEYEVKFGTRAILQLERDYPELEQLAKAFQAAFTGMKAKDLINFLIAGLIHTKEFADKEVLIDAIEPKDFPKYADAIVSAYMQAKSTPEQLEKLQVMAEANGSKKNAVKETTPENGPSTESSAD